MSSHPYRGRWWVGGWVGGWVGDRKVEENEAVRMRCCGFHRGGWVGGKGGWVGGWVKVGGGRVGGWR